MKMKDLSLVIFLVLICVIVGSCSTISTISTTISSNLAGTSIVLAILFLSVITWNFLPIKNKGNKPVTPENNNNVIKKNEVIDIRI